MILAYLIILSALYTQPIISKIEIRSVDFSIESAVKIDSASFEHSFNSDIKSITIIDRKTIEYVQSIIEQLKPDTYKYRPDVRAQIHIFWSDGTVDIVSMSDIGIEINGISYLQNEDLVRFVELNK